MNKLITASLLTIIFYSCKNNDSQSTDSKSENGQPKKSTPFISYTIENTYPHSTASFTQGLTFYKGELYEGTGEKGESKLMKVDLKTGNILKEISLDNKYFGEGITVLNDSLFQLTWQEHVLFLYDVKTFKKLKEFPLETEGWGITNDGKHLIVSTGTSDLYFYEPSTFKLLNKLQVKEDGALAYNLNELEYINGFIYANQWHLPYILKIDPSNGKVVAKINLDDVWKKVRAYDPNADVPNGIAYDSTSGKIYVTGKRWPELYEIKFSN